MNPPKEPTTDELLPTLAFPITEEDNHVNPIGAKYSLVEYGDYESSDCEDGYRVAQDLLRDLEEDLCFVFRNFPDNDQHPNAQFAAEAAEAAGMQGKFWLMHDRLFEHQMELSPPLIRDLAKDLPIDIHHFEQDLESGEPKRRVDTDRSEGLESGVEETPTFFVNGRMWTSSFDFDTLYPALTAPKHGRA